MPHNPKLDSRLDQVVQNIWNAAYLILADLQTVAWVTKEPVPYAKRTSGKRLVVKPEMKWGELLDCAWFNFKGTVPASARGKQIVLLLDVSGELLVVDKKGNPAIGLTSQYDWNPKIGLGAWNKREVPFLYQAKGGEKVDLWADAGSNNLFGNYEHGGKFKYARIAAKNPIMWDLFFDFVVCKDLMARVPDAYARHHQTRDAVHRVADVLRNYTEEEAFEARAILKTVLDKKNGDPSLTFSAVGHSHIDLAWLWPERETYRKGARTFATVLANMENYPDYVFGASQAQLYDWIKQKYPHLYERVKKRVAEGRWEVQGCMWVESDTNITGGESLIRQILFGKRFFREEFGKDIQHLWLPDVFGYTASLPQLLIKSGCPYFLTQKLSWNRINSHPHHTFWWEGIDGSRVLTHFPPEDTYNSFASPSACEWGEKKYKDKDVSDRAIMLFGIGDGGGGPGVEHLESLKRVKNLAGIAPVVQEPAYKFFSRLQKNSHRYATWAGELYLEFHQGTLTSQARNKRGNRKIEFALRELEWLATMAVTHAGAHYPSQELDRIWKRVLFMQFHDVLPGSSINRVYKESVAEYSRLLDEVESMTRKYATILSAKSDTKSARKPCIVYNANSWERSQWLEIDGSWRHVTVPSNGYAVIDTHAAGTPEITVTAQQNLLHNELVSVRFGHDGSIVSVYDRENRRETVPSGQRANVLKCYRDDGDAWDFTMDYADRPAGEFILKKARAYIDGPRAVREQVFTFGASTITQKVVVTAGSRRIDFITTADWKESAIMLRVLFPVDVLARETVCDIQFGQIKRPTHRNTSWDMAKQEFCAHKWVDLSEADYGVALLNDCKYGHQVKGNVISLNLLRSTNNPDIAADKARHEFTYALFPHAGDTFNGKVPEEGYALNAPLRVVPTARHTGTLPESAGFFNVSNRNIVIETVKPAESGKGVILRMYENRGTRTTATVRTLPHLKFKKATLVDLLEKRIAPVTMKEGAFDLKFGPFEILTVLLG